MARLKYIDKESATPEQEKILAQVTQKSGKIANIWRLWSHSPQTLEAFMPFYKALMKGELNPKLRELAYIKVSSINDCAYCATAHKFAGGRLGITEEQLQEIHNYTASSAFSPLEKLILRYAEEVTKTARCSDELVAELQRNLSTGALVELNLTVGTANLTNRFNLSFMTDPD